MAQIRFFFFSSFSISWSQRTKSLGRLTSALNTTPSFEVGQEALTRRFPNWPRQRKRNVNTFPICACE